MSDLYSELLVKKEQTPKDKMVKGTLITLTVLFVVAGLLLTPILLIGAIALGIACYFIVPRTDLEYEYLFVNGDMDIDVIMSKTKRKRVMTLKMEEVDLMAPVNSHRMDYHNGNKNLRVLDYSSGNPEHKRFALITKDDKGTCKVILEPDEHLAQLMRNSAPSKVFLD